MNDRPLGPIDRAEAYMRGVITGALLVVAIWIVWAVIAAWRVKG